MQRILHTEPLPYSLLPSAYGRYFDFFRLPSQDRHPKWWFGATRPRCPAHSDESLELRPGRGWVSLKLPLCAWRMWQHEIHDFAGHLFHGLAGDIDHRPLIRVTEIQAVP
jgi:hypothetical protein